MDDWEDYEEQPTAPTGGLQSADPWADEDADNSDVADEWDAEPEEEAPKVTEPPKPKKLSHAQILAKQEELEREERKRLESMTEAERMSEKLRMQKMVEEADNALTEELFAGTEKPSAEEVDTGEPIGATGDSKDVDADEEADVDLDVALARAPRKAVPQTKPEADVVLKTNNDYDEYAESVAKKVLGAGGKPSQTVRFCSALLKAITSEMRLDDVNEIKKVITVVYNETRKNEVGKKKKPKKKKFLNAGGSSAGLDSYGQDAYDDGDDYDFI